MKDGFPICSCKSQRKGQFWNHHCCRKYNIGLEILQPVPSVFKEPKCDQWSILSARPHHSDQNGQGLFEVPREQNPGPEETLNRETYIQEQNIRQLETPNIALNSTLRGLFDGLSSLGKLKFIFTQVSCE